MRRPGFAIVAIATLALGIGAATAVFSVLSAVLLRPVIAPDSDRIVVFGTARANLPPTGMTGGAPARFSAWRQLGDVFEDISAYRHTPMNLTGLDSPEQVQVAQVSEAYFRLFGHSVARGRVFTPSEDLPNAGGFAIVSDAFWRRAFGGADAIGSTVFLGGLPHQVIGVMAPDARPRRRQPDVWIPFQIDPASSDQGHFFTVAGRVKPGVSQAEIETRLEQSSAAFAKTYPNIGARLGGSRFVVRPIGRVFDQNLRQSLLLLLGAVVLVLLIACANVANLLLARGVERQREIALRAGLGAGRGRLVRQLLTEIALLWTAGAALGVGCGLAASRALVAHSPVDIGSRAAAFSLDWRVLAFALLISAGTAAVFGFFPALRASSANIHSLIQAGGGHVGAGSKQSRARSLLVVGQVALAMALVVGSGLLIRTFLAMRSVDSGFDARNVLTVQVLLDDERFATTDGLAAVVRESIRELTAIPGVESASAGCCLPIGGVANGSFTIDGRDQSGASRPRANMPTVSAGYFEVSRIPLLEGRPIVASDDRNGPRVAVVNQTLARQHWPAGDALGAHLAIGPEGSPDRYEIVGVAGDVRYRENGEASPTIYLPLAQMPDGATGYYVRQPTTWMIRTHGSPHGVASTAKQALEKSTGLPAISIRSMEEVVASSTARSDFNVALMLAFGGVALALSAVGVFALMTHNVQRRRREVGVRLALGADRAQVRNLVLLHGARLVLFGMGLGLLASLGLSRLLSGLLFGVEAHDPVVFVASAAVLMAVALVAAWLPAMRASWLDPVAALRQE